MPIPLFKPSIRRKDMDSVLTCLVNDAIGPGDENKEFCKAVAKYIHLAGGIALREGSQAARMVFDALGLEPGKEVILSPLSPAYYISLFWEKDLIPVYADVDPSNGTLRSEEVEKRLSDRTGAVMVHYPLGFVPETERIASLGVPVIEDCTESLGANTGTTMGGGIGRFTLVGTEPRHMITTGGGTVALAKTTRDFGKLRSIASGMPADSFLPDMNAALGVVQLKEIERFIEKRRGIAATYTDAVYKTRHPTLIQQGDAEAVWFSFPVYLETGMNEVRQYTLKKHVETAPAFSSTAFEYAPDPDNPCPEAKGLLMRCLLFPLYPTIGRKNAETVAKVLATLP
jgi:dTDP-4-amino-4,6-dideoxygalactose transaminase